MKRKGVQYRQQKRFKKPRQTPGGQAYGRSLVRLTRQPAYRANAGRAANYATFRANIPEVKYMDHSFGDLTVALGNTWAMTSFRNLTPSASNVCPIIPQGLTSISKVGNKAKLISLEIKGDIIFGNVMNSISEEMLEIMLVRKGQTNRADHSLTELLDISPNGIGDLYRFRNQEFTENYKVLKHWKIPYNPTVVSFPAAGGSGNENQYARKMVKFHKFYKVWDIYENDDASGVTAGNTGASYSIWTCTYGANTAWAGAVRVRFTDL